MLMVDIDDWIWMPFGKWLYANKHIIEVEFWLASKIIWLFNINGTSVDLYLN